VPRKKTAKKRATKKRAPTAIVDIDGAILWEGQATIYKTKTLGQLVIVADSKDIGKLLVVQEEE